MKKLCLILFLFLFLSGCNVVQNDDMPYVKIEAARYHKINDSKVLQGYIDRGLDVELSFGLSGIMNGIYVFEGEFVKKGKLLAKLDNDEYKLGIQRARAELDDATVKYDRAKSYFERISKLHSAGGISYNDWEAAQTDLKSSINQIEILKDAFEIAKNKETFSNIYAPYDGYVIKTYKDKMQFAAAGEKVILFQGKGMLEARIFASQNDVNDIKIGKSVILRADAIKNKEYYGKVKTKVNSSINEGSYRITVSIEGENPELLDGMSVNVQTNGASSNCGIFVPMSAISSEQNKNFVYILQKENEETGFVFKREVLTGEINGDKIRILKGLNSGELIVVEGINKIMDGLRVGFLW